MATGRGYLGKISAVVAANTGDYVRKLNDSASRTKSFANEISGDLRRASTEINKSISSILTPLQRYERAIQNAAAQKLSFRGFDGAIATVEQLRKTIASLSDRPTEVEFIVRQSGLKNIEQVRQVLGDLKQSEVDLAINVGGVAGLRRLREEVQEVDGRTINVETKVTGERLDTLIEKFSALSPEGIRQLRIDVETRQLEQAVVLSDRLKSATFGITDAYGAAKQQFAGFSAEVQAALGPAVQQTDKQVLDLVETIESRLPVAESAFQKVADAARSTGRAIKETAELQSRIAALPTGRELAFQNPQLDDLLARAGRAGESASRLPAGRRASGDVGSLVAEVNRLATSAGVAEAAVAGIVDPGQFAAARAEANRLQAEFQAAVELLEEQVPVKVDADEAIRDAERLRATLQSIRDEANFTITGEFQNLRQAEDSVRKIVADLQKLGTQQSAGLNPQIQNVLAAIELGDITLIREEYAKLKTEFDEELRIKVDSDEATAEFVRLRDERNKFRSTPGDPEGPFGPPRNRTDLGDTLTEAGRRRVQGLTGNVDFGSAGQSQRDIDGLASRVGAVRQQLETLPNSLRTQFIPALQRAQQQLIALQNSPSATAAQIDRAAASVKNLETQAKRAAASLQLPAFSNFMDDFSAQRAVGELNAFQQVLARVGALAGGPGARAYETYRLRLQEAIRTGTTGLPRVRKELERLQVEAARAAAATGKISVSAATRAIQRGGDVARGVGNNAGLAIQQAIFAFDDFNSVTGGLDQRIRAAGNNISQLGFILGGTAGLLTGVVTVAVAQLVAGFIRTYTEADKAEAAVKRLNEALQSQRARTESLADSYRQLADAIAEAGLSEQARQDRSRREPFREIEREQADRRRDIATANAPQIGAAQARIDAIDKELEQEENLLRRRALLSERSRRQAEVDNEISLIQRQGERFAGTAIRFQPGDAAAIRSLERGPSGLQETRAGLARAERRGDAGAVERLSRQLASLEVAIQLLRDRQVNRGFERQQEVSDRLARTQQNLQGVGGFRFSDFLGSEITGRIEDLRSQFSGDADLFKALSGPLNNLSASLEAASSQVAEFAAALERGAVEIARAAEQDLSQQSTNLRRQANAAEASFGANDPRTRLLRDQQERAEAARQQATRNRLDIERQASGQRLAFEESAILGRGGGEAASIGSRIAELQRLIATPATDQLGVTERENARLEVDGLRARLGEIFDARPDTQDLRRRADDGDVFAQRQIQQIESESRGRELSLTPAQRAAEELNRQMQDIRNYFSAAAENSDGLPASVERIREQLGGAVDRAREDILRREAPAVFALADEVKNAILQGPSRAALGATDASTIEGQRELNRLLRGDDSARDVDLAALQEQSNRLLEVIADNTAKEDPVANN
jgi:hypothetical protein